MYYYFIENKNDVFIRQEEVDIEVYPQYIPLTADQVEYFETHRDAKRAEIENLGPIIIHPTVETLRPLVLARIDEYDTSNMVNIFYIGEFPMWLDKATRTSLQFTLNVEEASGRTDSTLWYGNTHFTLPIAVLKVMLGQVELYAKACYNVTQTHKAAVMEIDNVEDLEAFDISEGYPEPCHFDIPE